MTTATPSATPPAPDDHSAAVGRTETRRGRIDPERAAALAATLDLDGIPGDGRTLPPGWHWLYFNPFVRRGEIGADGHPRRGGFLPDVGLPRRMWAGGRVTYHAPLPLGAEAEKRSTITDVTAKSGKGGRLVFVTVRHAIHAGGTLCVEEEQDIVYREAAVPGAPSPTPAPAPEGAERSEEVVPDPVLLFRYSALTANGHRIHYDRAYARDEEHYPDLVVHGPLTATLLQGLAARCRPGLRLHRFSFRGMAPLFVTAPFRIEAKAGTEPDTLDLWACTPGGGLAMRADVRFTP
ncbi:acyl-CoA dehydrogenase [Azospirillum sp. RWY-5-1]|uniref:Acyl-CoA dehydrogenase n=1 Tax=Azospirillum oleiclasticum TaxID=2735135 RepID=A0ABX2TDF8_9PROT|nr:MaoC family dehydratase N-terminal domain-containing protein [Azospirillum oleiclasticum]NYZ14711.1 acyl-CoA dehydrogenase [Azospirillum oleiclasticum]NYZ22303.1 acyl-CoA dehydrogenase [Azospirillum oleiclasticum]